jgi:hypothetical protein
MLMRLGWPPCFRTPASLSLNVFKANYFDTCVESPTHPSNRYPGPAIRPLANSNRQPPNKEPIAPSQLAPTCSGSILWTDRHQRTSTAGRCSVRTLRRSPGRTPSSPGASRTVHTPPRAPPAGCDSAAGKGKAGDGVGICARVVVVWARTVVTGDALLCRDAVTTPCQLFEWRVQADECRTVRTKGVMQDAVDRVMNDRSCPRGSWEEWTMGGNRPEGFETTESETTVGDGFE